MSMEDIKCEGAEIKGTTLVKCTYTSCKEFAIPYGIEVIGDYAFEDCTSLTSIEIPNSLREIGNCAFDGCFYEA